KYLCYIIIKHCPKNGKLTPIHKMAIGQNQKVQDRLNVSNSLNGLPSIILQILIRRCIQIQTHKC
ncbi:MAG TPA: hypothetical protein PLS12_10940, partial [Bacteroidales bacterium]|nr:hypothetical protein [Bacteroidales bacterium]